MQNTAPVFSRRRYAWINAALLALLLLGLILARNVRLMPTGLLVGEVRLPATCLVSRVIGRPCLGCGMTRSVVLATAGAWRESMAMHPSGIWLLVYALTQVAARSLLLIWRPSAYRVVRWDLTLSLIGLALATQAPMGARLMTGGTAKSNLETHLSVREPGEARRNPVLVAKPENSGRIRKEGLHGP